MKWLFYLVIFIYLFYRAVYGMKSFHKESEDLTIEPVDYGTDKSYFKAGARATIICKGTNKNQKLEWVNPSGLVVERLSLNRVFVKDHFVPVFRTRIRALMLVFTHTLVGDTGIWECRSENLSQNISLCVIDPSEFVVTHTEVIADFGRSITLTCQTKGDPEPRLIWYKNEDVLTENNDTFSSKFTTTTKYNRQGFESLLTITSLNREDRGNYFCEALQESPLIDGCSASSNMNITLKVNFAPYFEDGNDPSYVYAEVNESVSLVCNASAHPPPTYKWYVDTTEVLKEIPTQDIEELDDGQSATITFKAKSFTFANYICRARNDYGKVDKLFVVMKLEKPTKADKIEGLSSSADSVTFIAKWHGTIVFPVEEITVQYKNIEEESAWTTVHDDEFLFDTVEGLVATINNLEEATQYMVRVLFTNKAGDSPWTEPIFVSTISNSEEEGESEEDEEESRMEEESLKAVQISDGTFYGIFFAGGIIIVSVGSMLIIRRI